MRNRLIGINEHIKNGKPKQIIAFVVPTRILVNEQAKYLRSQLKEYRVKEVNGHSLKNEGKSFDFWSPRDWSSQLDTLDVMILVPDVLSHLLIRDVLSVSTFNCIILDECHHALGSHPMNIICQYIKNSSTSHEKPLIFGMTASPILSKTNKGDSARKAMAALQENTTCKIQSSHEFLDALEKVSPKPQTSLLKYVPDLTSLGDGLAIISAIMNGNSNITCFKSLFGDTQLKFDIHPVHILLHSFLRVRHTGYVFHILKLKKNFGLTPRDLYELTKEKSSLLGLIFPATLNLSDDCDYTNLTELQGMFGQICIVTLQCGILCGLNALKIVSKSMENIELFYNETGEGITGVSPLLSLSYLNDKKKILGKIDPSDTKLNSERLKDMSKELQDGIFELYGLSQVEISVMSSLLDTFIALLNCCYNSYGKELLELAIYNNICKKLSCWVINRIRVLSKRIEEFVEVKLDRKVDAFDGNIMVEEVKTENQINGFTNVPKSKRYLDNIVEERNRQECHIEELVKLKEIEVALTKLINDNKIVPLKNLDEAQAKLLIKTMQYFSTSLGFVVAILLCEVNHTFRDESLYNFTVGACDTFENFFRFYKSFSDDQELASPSVQQFKSAIYDSCSALLESVDSFKYLVDLNDINSIHLETMESFQSDEDTIGVVKNISDDPSSTISSTISNVKIKMISNKLLSLLNLWSLIENDMGQDTKNDGDDMYDFHSIIFCKLRLTAQTIYNAIDLIGIANTRSFSQLNYHLL